MNSNAFDHWTGLIGYNGVSVLNFVWIATIILNIHKYINGRKTTTLILILFQIILMTHMSAINENKMWFVTLFPIIIIAIFAKNITKPNLSYKKLTQLFLITLFFPVLTLILLNSSTFVNEINYISEVANDFFYGDGVPNHHNERAYLNYLAFNYYGGSNFGTGLSKVDFSTQRIHIHYGINTISLLIIQGGVGYLIAAINLFSVITLRLFSHLNKIQKASLYSLVFSATLTMSFATQIFRDHYIAISFSLILLVIATISKEKLNKNTQVANF